MELIDFLGRLHGDVADAIAARADMPGGAAPFAELIFTDVFARHMAAGGLIAEPQLCHYSANVDDAAVRLSGYALSEDGEGLDLFVSEYVGSSKLVNVSDDEVRGAAEQCARFLSLCVEGTLGSRMDESHDAFALTQTIRMAWESIEHVRIYVLTDGRASAADFPLRKIHSKNVGIEVVDIERLSDHVQRSGLQDEFVRLAEFRQQVLDSVSVNAAVSQEPELTCFVEDAGERLTAAEEFVDFQRCQYRYVERSEEPLQVDGYAFDDVDGSLSLLVADYSGQEEMSELGDGEVRQLVRALVRFAEAAISGDLTTGTADEAEPGIGLAAEIVRQRDSITKFRFYVVSDRMHNASPRALAAEDIAGLPVELQIWDVARFYRASVSDSGRDDLNVSFCAPDSSGLPALHAGSAEGDYDGYLCTIRGDILAAIYEEHGSRLLEGNVRSFLSTKGKINSSIQATIQEKPGMFFAYNNGISATAEDVVLDTTGGLVIVSARNLQIVNGGQTTASLASAARAGADLSRVYVQMKLSVLPAKRAGELIPLIARFANSQNKVNESDFFANHPYHLRIEQSSQRLVVPAGAGAVGGTRWFYERARGQYVNEQKNLSTAKKAEFLALHPKAQLLTKLDVAKLENSWKGYPHKVSTGAQKNFVFFAGWLAKRWTADDSLFDDRYFKNVVSMALLFRHTELLVKEQPWYQGAYRPNIVTYSVAMLQYLVIKYGKSREIDLENIWDTQTVSTEISIQLALIAKSMFDVLTNPARAKANVTEWAKMEACWNSAREMVIPLNPDVFDQLIDPAMRKYARGDSLPAQHVGYGVFARTAVLGVDPRDWDNMREWGTEKNLLRPRELELLRMAVRIPKFLPGVKDCEKIWDIRSKLIKSGFGLATQFDG